MDTEHILNEATVYMSHSVTPIAVTFIGFVIVDNIQNRDRGGYTTRIDVGFIGGGGCDDLSI